MGTKSLICLAAAALALLAGAATAQSQLTGPPEYEPLAGAYFGDKSATVVAFVHGDVSGGGPADYMYPMARELAAEHGVATAAVLRPGYFDSAGRTSVGSDDGRVDHYTESNNALLADTLEAIKARAGATTLIVVAHAGGAAQAGVVLGARPGVIDKAILVSCPCNVPLWRERTGETPWTRSQSPHDFGGATPPETDVVLIAGSADAATGVALALNYISHSAARVNAKVAPGRGDQFGPLRPEIEEALADML